MTELFRWYLARMRIDSQTRESSKHLTPMTLVARDQKRIQELIENSGKVQAGRSSQVLRAIRKREKNPLNNLVNAGKMAQEQEAATAILLAALENPGAIDKVDEITLEQAASMVVRELRQAREGERLIADCTPELLCCLDENHLIVEINVEFSLACKYQRLSVLAVPIQSLMLETDVAKFTEYLKACREGSGEDSQTNLFECPMKTADGQFVDIEWRVEWSATAKSYFCQGRDVTERKQRQRLQTELAAMVSHDLRTPVTGLGLVLENMGAGTYGQLSEAGIAKVAQARQSIEHMAYLLDQLLDAEKVNAGELPTEREPIPMRDVYASCANVVRGLQETSGIKIDFPALSEHIIIGDKAHTVRVLSNLISNALKYAPRDSQVLVEEKLEEKRLVVSVSDRGPGIPEDLQPVVFLRFKSGRGGTGLGLFIAKKLVELQGGEIGFKTAANDGTTFWFALPGQSFRTI